MRFLPDDEGGIMIYQREEIIKYILDYFSPELLAKAKRMDSNPNGLQVRGKEEVRKLALGVGIDVKFLKKCLDWGSDFIITHHGLNLNNLDQSLNSITKDRLKIIFENDLTLMGFHYALDAHREIGHNAQILKGIGAEIEEPFFDEWGWTGIFRQEKDLANLIADFEKLFNHKPVKVLSGKKQIKRLAVTSGGGAPKLYQMKEFLEAEIDLYVTGTISESTPSLFEEAGINYLAFGHYDTEKIGLSALGEILKNRFPGLEIRLIDIPNPF